MNEPTKIGCMRKTEQEQLIALLNGTEWQRNDFQTSGIWNSSSAGLFGLPRFKSNKHKYQELEEQC